MKSIVAGTATEHAENGMGPTILMLHGWGDSLHSFDELTRKLEGFRVIRLDLPGFGNTELPKGTWDVDRYTRFVHEFCKKLNVEPEYVLGHSFGGRILIKALANNGLSPKKLILVGSAGVAERETLQNNTFMYIAKVGKLLLKPFPKSWYLNLRKELYRVTGGDYVSAGALKETFLKVIQEDLSEAASRIKIPTLLIWGEEDIITPLAEGEKLNKLIHNSKLVTYREAGHFVHKQKAAEVAQEIRDFLL